MSGLNKTSPFETIAWIKSENEQQGFKGLKPLVMTIYFNKGF
jgi:hypothetical protein